MAHKTNITLTRAIREKIKKENAKQAREVGEKMVKRMEKKDENWRKEEKRAVGGGDDGKKKQGHGKVHTKG